MRKKAITAPDGNHSAVLACGCKHQSQDDIHGPGQRVHNWADGSGAYRCTVCGTERMP